MVVPTVIVEDLLDSQSEVLLPRTKTSLVTYLEIKIVPLWGLCEWLKTLNQQKYAIYKSLYLLLRRQNEYPGQSLKKLQKQVRHDEVGREDWMPTDEVGG